MEALNRKNWISIGGNKKKIRMCDRLYVQM